MVSDSYTMVGVWEQFEEHVPHAVVRPFRTANPPLEPLTLVRNGVQWRNVSPYRACSWARVAMIRGAPEIGKPRE